MKTKKTFLLFLTFFLLLTIFFFSSENGVRSESTSDAFTSYIIDGITHVTKTEIKEEEKLQIIEHTRFLVRKSAHFALFFGLGIFVYLLFSIYGFKHAFLLSIFVCFMIACTDEIHQLFSIGRTARIFDVFVDTTGSSLGTMSTYFFRNLKEKRKENLAKR